MRFQKREHTMSTRFLYSLNRKKEKLSAIKMERKNQHFLYTIHFQNWRNLRNPTISNTSWLQWAVGKYNEQVEKLTPVNINVYEFHCYW